VLPDAGISIRRLDEGAPPRSPSSEPETPPRARPAAPTLLEARQHLQVGNELRRQGDLEGAYREFEVARELFRAINNRGGVEGVQAAQGYRESNRAIQQIGGAGR
jgi:ribosomal protein S14